MSGVSDLRHDHHVLLRAIWDKYPIFRHKKTVIVLAIFQFMIDSILCWSYPHCIIPIEYVYFLMYFYFLIYSLYIPNVDIWYIPVPDRMGIFHRFMIFMGSPYIPILSLSIAHPLAIWGGTNDAFDSPGRAIWAFLGCPLEAGGDFCFHKWRSPNSWLVYFIYFMENHEIPPLTIVISTINHRIQPLFLGNWTLSNGGPILCRNEGFLGVPPILGNPHVGMGQVGQLTHEITWGKPNHPVT
jgi:hypothetical protein